MRNASDSELKELLARAKTVAVVGASPKTDRASNHIVEYLKDEGYDVYPINPQATEIHGLKVYPDLASLPVQPDIVDIFRKSEDVPPIIDEALAKGTTFVWMQESVISEVAAEKLDAAGIPYIMDRCILKMHRKLMK